MAEKTRYFCGDVEIKAVEAKRIGCMLTEAERRGAKPENEEPENEETRT